MHCLFGWRYRNRPMYWQKSMSTRFHYLTCGFCSQSNFLFFVELEPILMFVRSNQNHWGAIWCQTTCQCSNCSWTCPGAIPSGRDLDPVKPPSRLCQFCQQQVDTLFDVFWLPSAHRLKRYWTTFLDPVSDTGIFASPFKNLVQFFPSKSCKKLIFLYTGSVPHDPSFLNWNTNYSTQLLIILPLKDFLLFWF